MSKCTLLNNVMLDAKVTWRWNNWTKIEHMKAKLRFVIRNTNVHIPQCSKVVVELVNPKP
jgi:hypothetical protein